MLSDYILQAAADRYSFNRNTLQYLTKGRDSANLFYTFSKEKQEYILRIAKGSTGMAGQSTAEMDWMAYLSKNGLSVPVPFKAVNGEYVIVSEENSETYVYSAYSRVKGKVWDKNDPDIWNDETFYRWGKVMGDIHHVTKDYRPLNGKETRPDFSNIIQDTVKAFPSVSLAAQELLSEIKSLPKDRDCYGLIHYDMNPDNFLIDGNRINVFDFADCTYAWYALDIGCALAVSLWLGQCSDSGYDFTNDLIKHFIRGYRSANHLDAFWLSKVPLFMRLCQIAGFSCLYDHEAPKDKGQKEQLYNIENHIFMTGCTIDYSLFGQ